MRRREVIARLGGIAIAGLVSPVLAQNAKAIRVGYLSGGTPGFQNYLQILIDALGGLGWRNGERLHIEARYAHGDASQIPVLARELVALSPELIACTGAREAKALQASTREIPIVFILVLDPVGQGLVASIARPGRNITGLSQGPQILWGKRLDMLSMLLGRTPRRLVWLGNPANPGSAADWADANSAGSGLGAAVTRVDASDLAGIDRVFDELDAPDALLVPFDFLFSSVPDRIAQRAREKRLPVVYANRSHVLAGGLMSYGGDIRENFRQAAVYVDLILKGARAGDLPVFQASRFELVLNVAAAKDLGLAISPALLAQADEVIE
jgi:putative ABC transport system substrate-binding protein